MAVHLELGKLGEELAEKYLIKNGFTILHRNWRYSHYEIDIIALHKDLLHFVEVKIRSSRSTVLPEENVTPKKIKFLLAAADEYLFRHPRHHNFQLDVLSITTHPGKEPEYFFIQDVYL